MKIIKITEKEFPMVVDKGYGNEVESAYEYTLFFDDGSQLTRDSLLCEDKWLEVGDEVYVYGNLISRRPISSEKQKQNLFVNALIFILVIALFVGLLWYLF